MAQGPSDQILVTFQITIRIQESEVRNPDLMDYRKSTQWTQIKAAQLNCIAKIIQQFYYAGVRRRSVLSEYFQSIPVFSPFTVHTVLVYRNSACFQALLHYSYALQPDFQPKMSYVSRNLATFYHLRANSANPDISRNFSSASRIL